MGNHCFSCFGANSPPIDHFQPPSDPPVCQQINIPLSPLPPPNIIPNLRIATWNIQMFNIEKAQNGGVKEVVCLTILRNRLNLLVLQEVTSPSALELICEELNNPRLPSVQEEAARMGIQCWRVHCSSTSLGRLNRGHVEYGALLVNEAALRQYSGDGPTVHVVTVRPLEASPHTSPDRAFCRSPILFQIKAGSTVFTLAGVHLKAVGLNREDEDRTVQEVLALDTLLSAAHGSHHTERTFLLCGDFNLKPTHEAFNGLTKRHGMVALITDSTNISVANPQGNSCTDSIWWNPPNSPTFGRLSFTGNCGVIRHGLRHPLIPSQNGQFYTNSYISDHCPVWADFYLL